LKIAAAQTVVSSNIAANGSTIRELISSAAGEGVRLINFCEGALSGYAKFQIERQQDWNTFDWTSQEAELSAIAELCARQRVFAVVGGAHRLSDRYVPVSACRRSVDDRQPWALRPRLRQPMQFAQRVYCAGLGRPAILSIEQSGPRAPHL